jgi:hypothetical protein
MRALSPDLRARLDATASSLCHVWHLTLADGRVLAFTDHDQSLNHQGRTASAASGWTQGVADASLGSEPGNMTIAGGLDTAGLEADGLSDAAIRAGLADNAAVSCWLVDWSDPTVGVELWQGRIRRLVSKDDGFVAEISGPLAELETIIGRTYGRLCDARLGDVRCGLAPGNLAAPTCDKRYATCRDVFQNSLNFRGFPFIPGDDFISAHPVAGQVHDGGRR